MLATKQKNLQMKDIEERKDLFKLLEAFYVKAFADELIGFYFTDVIKLDLEMHLPVITDFWESVLLNTKQYRGDVMKLHQHINHLSPFKAEHFDRWVQLFCATVNEFYEGEVAERAKQRALSIATIMKIKLIYGGIN